VIWGCSFWWIKLGLRFLTPVEVAFGRLVLGAAALAVVSVATGSRLPRRGVVWWHLSVVALLLNSVPFTLFAFGETRTSSIMAGILNALTPLATLAVTIVAFPAERPTPERVLGLAVGFGGVLVVLGVWRGFAAGQWAGVAACLGAVCCYGVAFPYARRHLSGSGQSPTALATAQVLVGAGLLLPVALVSETGPANARPGPDLGPALGMIALGVLGTGIAYVLNFQVIRAAGSATASAVTYLTPVVAVVVGIAFLGEHVAWHQPVGAIVVLAGVALSQGLASRRGGRLGGHPPVRRSGLNR
jgi:drug/metabolite transporter (DMT)-like permease